MKFTRVGEIVFGREDEEPNCDKCSSENYPRCAEFCGPRIDFPYYQRIKPIVFCGNCEHHGLISCRIKDWHLTANNDFCAWGTPKGQED